MAGFRIYDLSLKDLQTGTLMRNAGGTCQVNLAGAMNKATLYDPDNNFVSLANPIALNNGKIRFATADTVLSVDLYGIAGTGHGFVFPNVGQEAYNEIGINKLDRNTTIIVPFAIQDSVAATEKVTGLVLPANLLIDPFVMLNIVTVESAGAKTIGVGINSAETNGNATGFAVAASTATAGLVKLKSAATATRGAFIGGSTLDTGYVTDGVAKTISYTLVTASVAAQGLIILRATICDTITLLP